MLTLVHIIISAGAPGSYHLFTAPTLWVAEMVWEDDVDVVLNCEFHSVGGRCGYEHGIHFICRYFEGFFIGFYQETVILHFEE